MEVINKFPEVVEYYRMTETADYLLQVVVPGTAVYERTYFKLISEIEISKVTTSWAMEQINNSTRHPLGFIFLSKEVAHYLWKVEETLLEKYRNRFLEKLSDNSLRTQYSL